MTGKTRFDDFEGDNEEVRKGPGTKVDERPWTNPHPDKNAPWFEPRDFNHTWLGDVLAWWEPDLGLYVGGGITRRSYGFRKYPFANAHTLGLGYATKREAFRFNYVGSFRRKNSPFLTEVRALASGIDRLNVFGFGNETPDIADRDIYKVNPGSGSS